jgi:enoyl-CoA hydratase/carnithine racemase
MPELLSYLEEGPVLAIQLERPEPCNALNRQLQRELIAAWEYLEAEDGLLVGVIYGSANVFSVGHDVPELLKAADDNSMADPLDGLFPYTLSKPVIAAVEGKCFGLGFELALACDLRVAAEDASFGFPDTNLPVSYRLASVLLPRMTNVGIGLDLLLTGEVMGAEKMRQMRLVSRVAAPGEALSEALEIAQDMAARFKTAGAFKKQQIWQFSGLPPITALNLARSAAMALPEAANQNLI